MKKTLIINNKPFEYEEEEITYSNNFPITVEDARSILDLTQNLLSAKGVQVYLVFGTLLGAIRDKGLIYGDEDVDVFTDKEDVVYNLLPYLEKNGLYLVRYKKGSLFTFRINEKAYIDIYVLRSMELSSIWSTYCMRLHNNVTPKKYFRHYRNICFLGLDCMCVENPEALLEFWYGKNWRTPVSGHSFIYEVKSYHYWRKYISRPFYTKMGKLKRFIYQVIHKL